jgi:hypothetical protein
MYIGYGFGALLVVGAGVAIAIHLHLNHTPHRPRSDVPVTWEVERAPDPEHLIVTGLNVRVLEARLNLFNSIGLIGIKLTGRMAGSPGSNTSR